MSDLTTEATRLLSLAETPIYETAMRAGLCRYNANHVWMFVNDDVRRFVLALGKERNDMADCIRKLLAENARLADCHKQWLEKTEWVQTGIDDRSLSAKYLGWHRADVIRAENEALRKDAERYRHLRDADDVLVVCTTETSYYGAELDARIDAAMTEVKK